MYDFHVHDEWTYKPRLLAAKLRKAAEAHPVVVLTGARQVGKSTLLQEEEPFKSWRYATLDDLDTLDQAHRDPAALWAGAEAVVIDEIQKAPRLLAEVKKTVDDRRRSIRFALSGSANLMMMRQVSESLAGRVILHSLQPMTPGEVSGREPTNALSKLLDGEFDLDEVTPPCTETLPALLVRGFMPPVVDLVATDAWVEWWEGYVATYLERDLRQLSQVASLTDFRRMMQALALRSGQMLNQTDVARDIGLSQPTVHRYVSLLETTMVLDRLPAYSVNRTKRLIKTPKIYWADPGLASFLASHHEPEALRSSREIGGIFETLILLGLRARAQLLTPRASICYWRTTTGKEVDFVVEQGRRTIALEVKLTASPRQADLSGLRSFLDEYPEARAGVLVHGGSSVRRMDEKIVALPWWMIA
jgi:predicted AAA+ superfamily ATPase